jgi:hypothetical protein
MTTDAFEYLQKLSKWKNKQITPYKKNFCNNKCWSCTTVVTDIMGEEYGLVVALTSEAGDDPKRVGLRELQLSSLKGK